MKTRLSRVLACLFAGILTVTAADYSVFSEEETPEIKYYVCPNSKILKEDETDYSEMTANGALLFSAAANERESAQIILTKEGKYENFTLKLAGDLECIENGHTISSDTFEIFFEHYVKVEGYWQLTGSGAYPDALIPYDLATDSDIPEDKRANNFTIDENKKNQGLWFTINVPAGTPAGTYEGKLTGSLDVNVEVKVYDFELPQITSSCTSFIVSPRMKEGIETAIRNHIGIQDGEVKRQYQELFSELLNKRKISSGYVHSSQQDTSTKTLEADVEKLYKFITDPKTKSPYYDLSYLPDVYRDNPAPISLDCSGSKDDIIQDFQKKSGIELDEAEDIKAILQSVIPDTSCTQKDIVDQIDGFKGSDEEKEIASLLHYLLSTNSRINRYPVENGKVGVEMYLKAIVDKSYEKKFDMLQYAFIKDPCTDEPPDYSFRKNISALANSYIFDDIKKEIGEYISNPKDTQAVDPQIQQELRASLKKLNIMISKAPDAKTNQWRVILSEGIQAKTNSKVWEYYKQFAQKKYGIQETEESQIKFTEKYNTSEKAQKIPGTSDYYSISIELDYHMKGFMALYNDFSSNTVSNPYSLDFSASYSDYLNDPESTFWWYCCNQSGKNASVAGYMINCNQGNYYEEKGAGSMKLNLNPLAVARANKWQQFKLGISGEWNWGVDYYIKNPATADGKKDSASDRIFKDDIGITARGEDWAACDAMMVYPIKELLKNVYGITDETKQNEIASEYNYLCSSIRLENVSEAIDDYDYLRLAEQMADSYPDHPEYRDRLNSIIQTVIEPGNVDYTNPDLTNSANLTRARNLLAALLEGRFGNIKEVTNDGINNTFRATTDGVPVVTKWHTSNQVLCFDVCETNTYQNSNEKREATISLATSDWHRLNDLMTIDFEAKTISNCKDAVMVPKGSGWYTVQIPLNNVKLNLDSNEAKGPANGSETLSMVHFKKDIVYRSFLVDNFRILKEVTNDGSNNTFRATTDDVPVVTKWHTSNKMLCFDVYETNTYQNSNEKREATISLATSDWHRLNDLMTIDFEAKTISNCKDAVMVPKGSGWYTVQIPLNNVKLNLDSNEAKGPANGSETLSMVHFKKDIVYRSFLVDNFRILKEVTNDGSNNTFRATTDGVPVINEWKFSNKALCFDVCETDTYQNSNEKREATISLATSDWHRLNDLMTIDFETETISNCKDAVMVPKGNGWYTVQIPLNNVKLNLDLNEAKGPANGSETLSMVHFKKDIVYRSFLVDNFRLETAVGNGDLNGDGKLDKKDVTEFGDYLKKNGAPPQNAWEADLDHNGVLNVVDLTLLKRMQLTQ